MPTFSASASFSASTPGQDAWNVLFLVSHDIGRRFGAYDNREVYSPVIDRFAREAYRFDGHYCQWPLCGPSRANLFTGCRPPTTHRYDNRPFFGPFRERTGFSPVTIPEAFARAGYSTRAFGFVYHDAVDPPSWNAGHTQVPEWADTGDGYDDIPEQLRLGWRSTAAKELIRQRWQALAATGVTPEDLADPDRGPATERGARGPGVERFDGPDTAYPDGIVAAKTAAWLRERKHEEGPFFLAAGFVSGHTPFRAPAQDWDRYDREALTLPPFREPPADSPPWTEGDSEPSQFYTTHGYTRSWHADEEQARELLHGHYATISYTDRQIGTILAALDESGEAERTIVVITSDHGFHDGHHGYWGKHNLWEQSLQVPLLIRVPDGAGEGKVAATAGMGVSALTEHIDIFPTLCELTGIAVPPHVEGRSFAHLFPEPEGSHKDAVFAHRRHMWHDRIQAYAEAHTVRTERYRYTRYLADDRSIIFEELFDYRTDPDERVNRALAPVPDDAAAIDRLAGMVADYAL